MFHHGVHSFLTIQSFSFLPRSSTTSSIIKQLQQRHQQQRGSHGHSRALRQIVCKAHFTDDDLLTELKDWRRRAADELQRPLYQILSNHLLETIATKRPSSMEHLSLLPGIGTFKLNRYGKSILEIVKKYPEVDFGDIALQDHDLIDTSTFWQDLKQTSKKAKSFSSSFSSSSFSSSSSSSTTRRKASQAGDGSTGTTASKKTTKRSLRKRLPTMSDDNLSEMEDEEEILLDDLNEEQQAGAMKILSGRNVFVSGSAGTGKTFLLRYAIQELVKVHGEDAVAVTAPTGIAAVNVGGQTVHSFAGIGLGEGSTNFLMRKVLKNKSIIERWQRCKVLIIDEISMLDRRLFELLDEIARTVRDNDLPFGGIQLIAVGDFFQLPPVQPTGVRSFSFESPIWQAAGLHLLGGTVYLEKVERQSDEEFIKQLNWVRLGVLTNEFQRQLAQCLVTRKPKPSNGIVPTKIYAINKQVDEENTLRLSELPGEIVTMHADDKWRTKPKRVADERLLQDGINNVAPDVIELKVGAQVMLLRNRSRRTFGGVVKPLGLSLVNGSRGKIVSFSESIQRPGLMIPTVLFDNGMRTSIGPVEYEYHIPGIEGSIVRYQVPLKLAWATTVHKSQGCTLSCAELMLDKTFDYGQAYVALSRVKNMDGLWLSAPIETKNVKANPEVLEFYGYDE
eukprot:scaffold139_cov260-Ochromonas_danica.AAC.3